MKSVLAYVACLTLLLCVPTAAHAQKVLVNVWDGSEVTKIEPLFNRGYLPNLATIGRFRHLTCNEECFGGPCDCMFSVTEPQHATMLTGCLADVTGVYGNKTECTNLIPAGLTVQEILEANDPAIRTSFISSKTGNLGRETFGNLEGIVDTFYVQGVPANIAADQAISFINQWSQENFFLFVHFRSPDGVGHTKGFNSHAYTDAILRNDIEFGRILQALTDHGVLDQTMIYVLSDHGFGAPKETNHLLAPNTFIVSNDATLPTSLYMVDVAQYFLANFGLQPACPPPVAPKPPQR